MIDHETAFVQGSVKSGGSTTTVASTPGTFRSATAASVPSSSATTSTSTTTASPSGGKLTPPTTLGLIGDDSGTASEERAAGFTTRVVQLSWQDFETAPGVFSSAYQTSKQTEISSIEASGVKVVLDLGLQYSPQWIHQYPNSYYVNQYGQQWTPTTIPGQTTGNGDANLVFNSALRTMAAAYIQRVGQAFGSTAQAIRIGGGRDGELAYPPATTPTTSNDYWAFDALAQAQSPEPGWKPGQASPNNQAQIFLNWYLSALTNFQQWQVSALRSSYSGPIIILYPGWGIRPGQASAAVSDNLDGASSAEINGEIQRGDNVAGQVASINGAGVWAETTWLDAPEYGSDTSANPDLWTPVHYLASLVAANPYHPELWGENTGEGTASTLSWTISQACAYGVQGVVWFDENEMLSGSYMTMSQFASAVKKGCP